jgi:hypothetical protein
VNEWGLSRGVSNSQRSFVVFYKASTLFAILFGEAKLMKSRKDDIREIGKRKGDLWDRFDRLQRNTSAFSRGKGKRRTVQLFRTYQDLAHGRDH